MEKSSHKVPFCRAFVHSLHVFILHEERTVTPFESGFPAVFSWSGLCSGSGISTRLMCADRMLRIDDRDAALHCLPWMLGTVDDVFRIGLLHATWSVAARAMSCAGGGHNEGQRRRECDKSSLQHPRSLRVAQVR